METNFSYGRLGEMRGDQMSPLQICSLRCKTQEGEEVLRQPGDDVNNSSASPVCGLLRESPKFSDSRTEGKWAFQTGETIEDLPSLDVRHEAIKRVFHSISRLDTDRSAHGNEVPIGGFDKETFARDVYSKVQEVVERRVSDNLARLTTLDPSPLDIFKMSAVDKPQTAPCGDRLNKEKQHYFPELRGLIEDRLKETKVDVLTNRLERELVRRQNVCNEQALMLQILLNRVHDLEKRPQKRGSATADGWARPARSGPGLYCYTSDYVVEKATQTPSDLHDAEGVYIMVARNSGAKAKKVQKRFMYGYPEHVTEEKQVSSLLDRKIVTRHIEFLPPIPDPSAKKRPRDAKRAGWHTM